MPKKESRLSRPKKKKKKGNKVHCVLVVNTATTNSNRDAHCPSPYPRVTQNVQQAARTAHRHHQCVHCLSELAPLVIHTHAQTKLHFSLWQVERGVDEMASVQRSMWATRAACAWYRATAQLAHASTQCRREGLHFLVLPSSSAASTAPQAPALCPRTPSSTSRTSRMLCRHAVVASAQQGTTKPLPPSTAFVFPGQGAQKIGMTKNELDLPEVQRMYEQAEAILGYDIKKVWQQSAPKHSLKAKLPHPGLRSLSGETGLPHSHKRSPFVLLPCV